jgi:hypothetical protein
MQTIFGVGVATGRFAIGSNEPLGHPTAEQETIDLEKETPAKNKQEPSSSKVKAHAEDNNKKKRVLSDEDMAAMTAFTDAIWGLNHAVSEGNNNEAAPGIYQAVMGVPNISRPELMICLNYLMEHKGPAMVFLQMAECDKEMWCRQHLEKSSH